MISPVTIFFSYCHVDESLRDDLERQLSVLKREGLVETWHDRMIDAGAALDESIDARLESSQIIILLVSSDFLASRYCYEKEMQRALERHKTGEARVVPVILRPCDWMSTPLGGLLAVPRDGLPVTRWPDRDLALLDVVKSLRSLVKKLAEV